jgi:hypothetical protein
VVRTACSLMTVAPRVARDNELVPNIWIDPSFRLGNTVRISGDNFEY